MLTKMFSTGSIFFGVAYLFGILISSLYLADNNIHDLSLFKADYILIGSMFLFYLTIPGIVVVLTINKCHFLFTQKDSPITEMKSKLPEHIHPLVKMAIIVFVSIIIICFSIFIILLLATIPVLFFSIGKISEQRFTFFDAWKIYADWAFLLLYVFLLLGLCGTWACLSAKMSSKKPAVEIIAVVILLFAISILPLSSFYASSVYPNLPIGFGGGKPTVARIALTQDGNKAITTLGYPVDDNSNIPEAYIIHENNECYFLRGRTYVDAPNEVVRLPKSQILTLVILSK